MSLMQKIGMKRLLFDGNSTRIDKSFLPCPKMGYSVNANIGLSQGWKTFLEGANHPNLRKIIET